MYNKEILKVTLDKGTGYLYFLDKEHPLATGAAGRVYLHRHTYSIFISRWINSNEIIHHIDSNKINNKIDNLYLCSKAEHMSLHMKKDGIFNSILLCKNCRLV